MVVSNLEKCFIIKALTDSNTRLDERTFNTFQSIKFEFDPIQRGHVTVQLGHTKVLALTSATIIRPVLERPSEGVINYYLEFSTLCLPIEDYLDFSEDEKVRLQRLVDRILKNSKTVDTESLCIVPGEQVWSIRVDIHILNHDGNVLDAITSAAVAAMLDFRRPEVTISDSGVLIMHSTFEKHPIPLAIHNPPVSISFALIDPNSINSDHASKQQGRVIPLADPLWCEEKLGGGHLIMAINKNGELITMVKSGGESIDLNLIQHDCLPIAKARASTVLDEIRISISKARGK